MRMSKRASRKRECLQSPLTLQRRQRGPHQCQIALSPDVAPLIQAAKFTIQENVASTVPKPSSSIFTLSPALSHTVFTRLPVSTICPACNPLPSSAR